MRIQILPLPPLTLGDAVETPFIVAIDRIEHREYSIDALAEIDHMATSWGARGVLFANNEEIEINPHLDLPDELRQALLAHLTTATTTETP